MSTTRRKSSSKKSSARKSSYTRNSRAGRIMSPVDVRSPEHVKNFAKLLESGKITIVLVYADWCGHCHRFMPYFDKASKSAQRSVQVSKIRDDMVNNINEHLSTVNNNTKSINVSGYPTLLALSPNGEKVAELDTVHDEKALVSLMNNAGKVEMSEPAIKNVQNSVKVNSQNKMLNTESARLNSTMKSIEPLEPNINQSVEDVVSSYVSPTEPPAVEGDIIENKASGEYESTKMKGGSLYKQLASSAYHLAPAGILLGLSSAMKRRKNGGRTYRRVRISKKNTTHYIPNRKSMKRRR
jgi:thiol-disulfide isomerase/thioredoxin